MSTGHEPAPVPYTHGSQDHTELDAGINLECPGSALLAWRLLQLSAQLA